MRRLLVALVRWLGEALVRLYYPQRAVDGADRIPAGKPLVFVLNHPNGLLDPLVLRVVLERPARFLAKSTLFGNPLGRVAMDAFGSIPVYRPRDVNGARNARTELGSAQRSPSREGAGTLSGFPHSNEETFASCRAELAGGGVLALFPEGTSHSDPEMRPLKTGAARITLSAEAEHDGGLGVTVVPVGLSYARKTTFRSSVLLVVGEPIAVAPLLPQYRRDERATVTALTDQIGARLDEIVLQAESRELLAGIARVARWTAGPATGDDPEDPAARHRRAREMAAAYARMRARDPARLEGIVAEVQSYWQTLRRLGVRDPWALELTAPRPGAIAGALLKLVVAAPLAALGAIMGWLPYRLAGRIAPKVSKDEDVLSTVKLIAGALFLFLAWSGEAVAVGWRLGAAWGVPTFLAGVAGGYVALRFEELVRDGVAGWRAVSLRAFHFKTAQRLTERRRALADEVAQALAEESDPAP
ncbi:MAG TPA: lysophospholipid acyltransferase family protein [Polyangia bacterium]|nr:lysophospholipid acyltransferase family protein [Polyangia bacterium]